MEVTKKKSWLVFLALFALIFMHCQATEKDSHSVEKDRSAKACPLAKMGDFYKVDKFNPFQNYQSLYCDLFQHMRFEPVSMLEIGFGCGHHVAGASARLWKKFFHNLKYSAVDYMNEKNPDSHAKVRRCVDNFESKHPGLVEKFWLGDQSDAVLLQKIVSESPPFDIVVDDGGHTYDLIMASFKALWPHVAPGGYYVMEDLHVTGDIAAVVGNWTRLLALGVDTGRRGDEFTSTVPKDALIAGCAFKVCYVRKVHREQGEAMPKIWGEKYEEKERRLLHAETNATEFFD